MRAAETTSNDNFDGNGAYKVHAILLKPLADADETELQRLALVLRRYHRETNSRRRAPWTSCFRYPDTRDC